MCCTSKDLNLSLRTQHAVNEEYVHSMQECLSVCYSTEVN